MAEATNPAGEIDFTSLGGLSQEEVNKRLLAAMLMQGSAKYDQAMLADTLSRSQGAKPLGPRGRGMVGELNDFATAFRPGMERSRAQEMVKQLRAKDLQTMQNILGGGKAGRGGTDFLNATGNSAPPVDPSAGILRQTGQPALGINAAAAAGGPPGLVPQRKPNPFAPELDDYSTYSGGGSY